MRVKREAAKLREGPGSYYPVRGMLYLNDEVQLVKKEGTWFEIRAALNRQGWVHIGELQKVGKTLENLRLYQDREGTQKIDVLPAKTKIELGQKEGDWQYITATGAMQGWLAELSIMEKGEPFDLTLLLKDFEPLPVSDIESAMAVRGLMQAYVAIKDKDFNKLIPYISQPLMDIKELQREYFGMLQKYQKKVMLPKTANLVVADDPIQEERLSYIVAASILNQFSVMGPASSLSQYVNMVGTYVASFSPRYDLPFKFLVLESKDINSFSTPGGIIFVSSGLLASLQDESELAAILGHEIAHVALRHVKKFEEAKQKSLSGMNTSKMEAELEQALTKVHARSDYTGGDSSVLQKEIFQKLNFESERFLDATLMGGRGNEMEMEADLVGQLYALRAGYGLDGLGSWLARLAPQGKTKGKEPSRVLTASDLMKHPQPEERIRSLSKGLSPYQKLSSPSYLGRQRFQMMQAP